MILDTWSFGPLSGYLSGSGFTVILGSVVWLVRRVLRRREIRSTKTPAKAKVVVKTEAPIKVESKVEYSRLLAVLLVFLAVILAILLLVVVSLLQASLLALSLSIGAGIVAALIVMTAVLLGIGVPAYKFVMTLKAELQVLKEEIKTALAQSRHLEGKVNLLEAQLQKVPPEPQLLPPRKPAARKTKSPRDYLKQAKADAGD